MAPYSLSPSLLTSLAGALDDAGSRLAGDLQHTVPLLLDYGYTTSAQIVLAVIAGSQGWCEAWAGSLRERVGVITAMERVGFTDRSPDLHATWVEQRRWALHAGCDVLTWTDWVRRNATEYLMAAGAMLLGRAPDAVGLDPALFPDWYVSSHRSGEPARADRVAVLAHLDDLSPVADPARHELVGVLLARLFADNAGDPGPMQEIARLFSRHVDSTAEAVAFFNALPPHLLQAMTASGGLNPYDEFGKVEFMAPFAAGLAVASHSPHLTVDVASLVGRRDSGYWFMSDGYGPDFLVDALVASIGAGGDTGDLGHVLPDGEPLDARTMIMRRIAAASAAAAVAAVTAAGLLAEYVDPAHAYPDDGAAAGHLLGLLGRSSRSGVAGLIVELMSAIAATGGPTAVVRGAAVMVQPHLGALVPFSGPSALPETSLREALDDLGAARAATVTAFLERVMVDAGAADSILLAYSATLAAAVASNLEAEQPDSVAATFAESGRLFDLIADAALGPRLTAARDADRGNRALAGLIGVATDLALGFGLSKLAVRSTTQLATEGLWGALNDVAPPLAGFELLPTDQAEAVLIEGYDLERDAVLQAQLLLAVHLDAAEVISLPAAWWREGSLQPPSRRVWEEFLVVLRAEGFPVDAWFNHAAAIGGYVDFEPAID